MAGEHYDRIEVASRLELRAWLAANHTRTQGVWLVTYKKSVPDKHVSWDEIVEECLCFGWVDSLPRKLDDTRTMLLIAPRKPRSGWSAINKKRIEALIADGLMQPPGLARIDAAKADGSWTKLDGVETLEPPPDLVAALDALPPARGNFEAFPASARRGILEWIVQAKTDATRSKRIAETARLAQQNIRANQYQPKRPAD
jgi:uncharacterized protein YdeI (YjbR/CyaY-like superfamily)